MMISDHIYYSIRLGVGGNYAKLNRMFLVEIKYSDKHGMCRQKFARISHLNRSFKNIYYKIYIIN